MFKWLRIMHFYIHFIDETGAQSLRAEHPITWVWVSTWAQVFYTPAVVPVKMLDNCPPRETFNMLDDGGVWGGNPCH